MANTPRKKLSVILCDEYYPQAKALRDYRMDLWAEGIAACGDVSESISAIAGQFGDVCITWGPRTVGVAHQRAMHHLVMECGFLGDRLDNFYVGYSGLNGFGKRPAPTREGAGAAWYSELRELPVRDAHKNVVIFGQVAQDASLIPLCASEDDRPLAYKSYLANLANFLERKGLAVGFRGHPMDSVWTDLVAPNVFRFDHSKWPLSKVLEWADLAVAFSSNALVEAHMAGVDVIPAHPTSMCWDIRSGVDMQNYLTMEQRRAWLDDVASAQWSSAQIKSGEAWETIRPYFARSCNL
jgi:hypothetical protein